MHVVCCHSLAISQFVCSLVRCCSFDRLLQLLLFLFSSVIFPRRFPPCFPLTACCRLQTTCFCCSTPFCSYQLAFGWLERIMIVCKVHSHVKLINVELLLSSLWRPFIVVYRVVDPASCGGRDLDFYGSDWFDFYFNLVYGQFFTLRHSLFHWNCRFCLFSRRTRHAAPHGQRAGPRFSAAETLVSRR